MNTPIQIGFADLQGLGEWSTCWLERSDAGDGNPDYGDDDIGSDEDSQLRERYRRSRQRSKSRIIENPLKPRRRGIGAVESESHRRSITESPDLPSVAAIKEDLEDQQPLKSLETVSVKAAENNVSPSPDADDGKEKRYRKSGGSRRKHTPSPVQKRRRHGVPFPVVFATIDEESSEGSTENVSANNTNNDSSGALTADDLPLHHRRRSIPSRTNSRRRHGSVDSGVASCASSMYGGGDTLTHHELSVANDDSPPLTPVLSSSFDNQAYLADSCV